ncbi:unnamed protein product [Protopolystoma xenopodis]|uniref:Uncharacterized protein n=1 Tax=Protopolystoma xenopodis TaxID=117903 RepID=A0A3S5BRT2_9PLAT|nr:unnamed protein product [Protopolystoma xenopodis]
MNVTCGLRNLSSFGLMCPFVNCGPLLPSLFLTHTRTGRHLQTLIRARWNTEGQSCLSGQLRSKHSHSLLMAVEVSGGLRFGENAC